MCPFLEGDDLIHLSCASRAHANLVYDLLDMPLQTFGTVRFHENDSGSDPMIEVGSDDMPYAICAAVVCKHECTCPDASCLLEIGDAVYLHGRAPEYQTGIIDSFMNDNACSGGWYRTYYVCCGPVGDTV